MRKQRMVAITSLIVMFAFILTSCGAGGSGTLKVGVRDDIMNFGYLNEKTEKYYGLEVDIAKEMADRMGYGEVEFVSVKPETRKEMLLEGEVDCLVACYSISWTREENFDFSDSYYKDAAKLMVEKSSMLKTLDDLKGKTIGVMSGSNTGPELGLWLLDKGVISKKESKEIQFDAHGTTKYKNITIKAFDSYKELDNALEAGIIDATCMDGAIAQTFMDKESEFMDISLTEQNYGVATKKKSDLSKKVDKAIKEMHKDGTIKKLIDKWN